MEKQSKKKERRTLLKIIHHKDDMRLEVFANIESEEDAYNVASSIVSLARQNEMTMKFAETLCGGLMSLMSAKMKAEALAKKGKPSKPMN